MKIPLPIKLNLLLTFGLLTIGALAAYSQASLQVPKMAPYGRGYLEYLPAGYSTSTDLYPCIFFLHGSGERGNGSANDLKQILANGPPKHINAGNKMCFTVNGKTECFVVLSMQTNDWSFKFDVIPFVQYALATYRIDPDRLYLTGLSMGGEGTWLGASYSDNAPNYFAAIAPMAGRAAVNDGCNVAGKKIPVWAFHGDADAQIPLSAGQRPITGMTNCNANPAPLLTIYPGAGHGTTWNKGYLPDNSLHNPNVYQWFLAHKRNTTTKTPPVVNSGIDISITLPVNTVTLSGTVSDADGTISSTLWQQVSGPNSSTIASNSTLSTQVTGLVAGLYTFSLTAKDNDLLSTTDQIIVKVNPAPPKFPPTANAGLDKIITSPINTVALIGSGSDSDGTISLFNWTQNSGPNIASLVGSSSANLTANNLIAGVYTFELKVTDNDNLQGSDQVVVTVLAPPPNIPPVANAGSDKIITLPTNSVSIAGSGSDSDGTISAFLWEQSSGPSIATFATPNLATTTVSSLAEGVYVFTLSVTDNKSSTSADQVIVTVLPLPPNNPPVANAGSDIAITLPISNTTLNGSGTDSDGTISSYTWVQTSGPNSATIASTSSAVTGISNLTAGNYLFTLTVNDDKGVSAADQVLVIVLPEPPNQPPVSNAGSDISISLPVSLANLAGTGSDSDGLIIEYKWIQKNGPSPSVIVNPNQKDTEVNSLTAGVYTFELTVKDDKGSTSSDQILVTVFPPANLSPTANAGADIEITLPINSANLLGSGSDTDGTIASFLWQQVSGPVTANLTNAASASTLVNALSVSGIYVFSLTVTDNSNDKSSDQVTVKVLPQPPNQPPVAKAGNDITLVLPANSAILNGLGTDADGSIAGYHWNFIDGPTTSITLSDPDVQNLTVSGLIQGIFTFELVIVDDRGATATDEIKIFVNASNLPPLANAGLDKSIVLPINFVTITGISSDPDGSVISTVWEQVSGPNTAGITDLFVNQINPTGLIEGIYIFGFRVTDNENITDYDEMRVIVNPSPPNIPPVAIPGLDINITLPISSVTLTGSGTDSDGTVNFYKWSQVSGPNIATSGNVNQSNITFGGLAAGVYVFRLTVTDNLGSNGQAEISVRVNPQPVNIPPVTNAGIDQKITLPINTVTLSGSATDSDGTIASYSWTQTNGPSVATLSTPLSSSTSANNLVEGIYVFKLTSVDDKLATASDEVVVTVQPIPFNLPPIANGGGNKIITLPTTSIAISGNGSDQDGTIAGYTWSQRSGPPAAPPATTTSLNQKNITFSNLEKGIYVFRLTVTDNKGSTGFDEINIRVQPVPANQPPTSNAGGNKIITLPLNTVVFNGNGTDPDGAISNFDWTQISGPSPAGLAGASTKNLTASAMVEGTYIFRLTVTDNNNETGFDEVNVRVNKALPNAPPVANAGSNLEITLPINSVIISGSGSDVDGTVTSYDWIQTSGPNPALLTGNSTSSLNAGSLTSGVYIFQLTVTDNLNEKSFDEVQVKVNPLPPNQPPVVNAGADQSINIPPSVFSIVGTASDLDGTITLTTWSQISGPNNSTIANVNSLSTSLSNLVAGTYIYRLSATDDRGDVNNDDITLTVADNQPPIAFAGDSVKLIFPENSIALNGGGIDPDGTIDSFAWSQISGPTTASTSPLDQPILTITSLQPGIYVFELTVLDNNGIPAKDQVIIEIKNNVPDNLPPTADAGQDILITLPENSVVLQGVGDDSDGTITDYTWSKITGPPAGSISNPFISNPEILDLEEGTYAFKLIVADNGGLTDADTINITVLPSEQLSSLNFPKIFSPNGMPPNDTWVWKNTVQYQGCKLAIFNRFGQKVFETISYDNSWDGRSSDGKVLEEEAYFYIIKCDGSKDITGGIRIVR